MNGGEREGGRFSFYKSRRWNINITLSIVRARENFSSRLRRERDCSLARRTLAGVGERKRNGRRGRVTVFHWDVA